MAESLRDYHDDPANTVTARLTDDEAADLLAWRSIGARNAEALPAIGRADLVEPELPRLLPTGQYDPTDLARYLDQASARRMLPRVIARKLRVPPHCIEFFLGDGRAILQGRAERMKAWWAKA